MVNIAEVCALIDFYRRRKWDVSLALEFTVRRMNDSLHDKCQRFHPGDQHRK